MPNPSQNSPQMVTESLEEHEQMMNKGGGISRNARIETNFSNGINAHNGSIEHSNGRNNGSEEVTSPTSINESDAPPQASPQAYINGKGDLQRRSSRGRTSRVAREARRSNSDNGRSGTFFNPPPRGSEFGRTFSYEEAGGGGAGSGMYQHGGGGGGGLPVGPPSVVGGGPPMATPAPFQSPQRVVPRPLMHRRSTSEHFDHPPVYAQPPMLQPIIAGEVLDASLPRQQQTTPRRLARRETGGNSSFGGRPSYGAIGHGGDRRRYGSADDAKLFNHTSPRNLSKAASERQFTSRGELQNYADNFSPFRSTRTIGSTRSPRSPQQYHQQDFMQGAAAAAAAVAAPPSPSGSYHQHPLMSHAASMSSQSMRSLPPPPHMTGVYGGAELETDPFLSQHFGNVSSSNGQAAPLLPRQESYRRNHSRRTHMRHHSAQLFMSTTKGVKQPKLCRDLFFAILFLLQFITMIVFAIYFGPVAIANVQETNDINNDIPVEEADAVVAADDTNTTTEGAVVVVEYGHLLQLAIFCGLFACTLSGLSLFFMALFSKEVIKICLIASIALSFAWGTVGIGLHPTSFVPITGVIVLALCVGYAFVVWTRIPFAAANLRTGLAGVKSRLGVAGIAYLFQVVALCWSIIWVLAVLGVYDVIHGCSTTNSASFLLCQSGFPYGIMALFLVSYLWTLQVCTYLVQVVVAGSIENWWMEKKTSDSNNEDDDGDNNPNNSSTTTCCPDNVKENFVNAMTYSFGSICYGSLFVGPVQTLRQIMEPFRPKDEPSLLFLNQLILPVQRLLFTWIDNAAIHCNQWAFAYLGMYRYGFMQSGKLATDLLETRGWSNIANDDLLGNVVYMFGFVIGGCTGCFAAAIQQIDHYQIASNSNQATLAFFAGLLIGLVLSNVLMSAVIGSVNAVIICFAENPWEFQLNHPQLCSEMNLAWSTVWPGCLTTSTITHQRSSSMSSNDIGGMRDPLHSSLRPWDMAV